jgi:DNA phosphorothioation-dependent restriction protein DptG
VSKSGSKQLFDLYERMDRLEELIEDMEELGISTREEAEQMIVELDGQIEELESHDDSGD